MKSRVKKMLLTGVELAAKAAARSYVVGPELDDALRACRRLKLRRDAATIAYWNMLDESPRQVASAYLAALDALGRERLDAYLSIKAPFFGFDRALFGEILDRSRSAGARLHFDAQAYSEVDDVLALIDEALSRGIKVGCTLPGRWRRSAADADWVVERRVPVRVVKGQLADPTAPDADLREGFLAAIDRLAGRAAHVAVATHDADLAREALGRLQRKKTPCTLELLYGLPLEPARRAASELGVDVRIYIPYGHGFLPYWFAQGYRRPEIFWWMFRDVCATAFKRTRADAFAVIREGAKK
jgi:proline dehydrogenase